MPSANPTGADCDSEKFTCTELCHRLTMLTAIGIATKWNSCDFKINPIDVHADTKKKIRTHINNVYLYFIGVVRFIHAMHISKSK